MLSNGRIPIDPDSLFFLVPIGAVGALGWAWDIGWIYVPALVLSIAIGCFFRDPPRRAPAVAGALLSPADGEVVAIEPNGDRDRGPVPGTKIVIFLSVLNAHINRAPCGGRIERIRYERGLFLNALDPASSEQNESNWIFIDAGGFKVTVRQIAGLIARRIVCRVREGESVRRGQRVGLIRFGSRTELYIPSQAQIRTSVGEEVRAGRSVIAVMPEPSRAE